MGRGPARLAKLYNSGKGFAFFFIVRHANCMEAGGPTTGSKGKLKMGNGFKP